MHCAVISAQVVSKRLLTLQFVSLCARVYLLERKIMKKSDRKCMYLLNICYLYILILSINVEYVRNEICFTAYISKINSEQAHVCINTFLSIYVLV